jgi:hypothetical protein
MSKDFFDPLESEPLCFAGDHEPSWCGDASVRTESCEHTKWSGVSSLICPHTGKLTSHNASDLRAQLEQFRLGAASSTFNSTNSDRPRPRASANEKLVAVDDELHGRHGEWFIVIEATPDTQLFTLLCCESGSRFKRTVSAVHDDVLKGRLKVQRYGMPDIPPELEEIPTVARTVRTRLLSGINQMMKVRMTRVGCRPARESPL